MGWAHGLNNRGEEVGYGVEDTCHAEGCDAEIDRGLAYLCGGIQGEAFGGDGPGCGSYFCGQHLYFPGVSIGTQLCEPCCDAFDAPSVEWWTT